MHSEPRKVVLTSLVVSAVAIAAYVSHSSKPWLSTDEFGSARSDASAHPTRGDTISGAVVSGSVANHNDSSGGAGSSLQAARNSLLRNDIAAAQAQLDAVRLTHQDDQQVQALQREVQARADSVQHTPAAAQVGASPPAPASKPARLTSSPVKNGRWHERRLAAREPTRRASSVANGHDAQDSRVADIHGNSTSGVKAAMAGESVVASQPPLIPTTPQAVPTVSTAPAVTAPVLEPPPTQQAAVTAPVVSTEPPPELTAQAAQAAPPVLQSMSTGGTLVKTDGGPKTRAQVRAEIAHARADGSLPAFGNPDPAGPGGAPSMTIAPRP